MDVRRLHQSLPGHPDCGMITITYDFRGGIQACLIQMFAFTEKRITYPQYNTVFIRISAQPRISAHLE